MFTGCLAVRLIFVVKGSETTIPSIAHERLETRLAVYTREMGAICQIGVLTWKPCTLWVQMGLFSAFSHYVFNDCGPNRGFHSDFTLSPIFFTIKVVIFPFQVLASCDKVNLGQNALFCSIWTQKRSAKKAFLS